MNAAARDARLGADTFAEMDALGDARFAFVMRDPVDRLWSGTRHRLDAQLAAGEVTPRALIARFAASVEADDDRDVARCDYRRTIAALESSVDPRRVLYLFHETLFDQATCDRQTSFVGVDRRRAHPGRQVNRGPRVVRPDAAMRTRARERLAPIYDFVRERFKAAVPTTWMQ